MSDTVTTITVTIGRNVTNDFGISAPMSASDWTSYKADVGDVMGGVVADSFIDTDYTGTWQNVAEDAHVWHGQYSDPDDPRGEWGLFSAQGSRLREALGTLADKYGQEHIGLAFGQSELI